MKECEYEGYHVAVAATRRGRSDCFVMTDIRKGGSAWAHYRDVPRSACAGDVETRELAAAVAVVKELRRAER